MKDESEYSHSHEGHPDEPCVKCGLANDNPVHTADDPVPAPDPPPEGGSDYPPK